MHFAYRSAGRRLRAAAVVLAVAVTGLVAEPLTTQPAHAAAIEPPASVVELLTPEHPRLLATAETFRIARERLEDDARLSAWFAKVRADADAILPTEPVTFRDAPNTLSTSREVKRRTYTLAATYQLTGDERYAARGAEELLAVAAFPHWNPSHFLDVGEMTNAVAIGYDWLYDYLSEEQRATIRDAIVSHALETALPYYDTTGTSFFVGQSHNWNLVSNAVALGALAIGDEAPAIADEVLRKSITSIQYGITEYAPDGGYAESPAYWQYGTDYLVTYLAAMTTATGTDFGLAGLPGLSATGDFGIQVTGTPGQAFNFGDGPSELFGGVTSGWHSPFMMWLAGRYDAPHYAAWQAERADRSAGPLDILWYDPDAASGAGHPEATDAHFAGVEVATARSAWDDPQAVYVATKGLRSGYDQVTAHMNLDAGDFVLDANGVRWFDELGADTYQGAYFDWRKDVGGRWDYYVTRPEGQNTMLLGSGPTPSAALRAGAPITAVGSSAREWYSVTDLTGMYGDRVERAQRGVRLFDDRRQVLIQDEVEAGAAIDYRQFLLTRADVDVADDGRSAVLHRGGQRLYLQLLTDGGSIVVGDAGPLPGAPDPGGQKPVTGMRSLMLHLPSVTDTSVALRLVPLGAGQQPPADVPEITPLASWDVDGAGAEALTSIDVGGTRLSDFRADRYRYDVTVPANRRVPPNVEVRAADGVVATVSRPATLPGVARVETRRGDAEGPVYEVHFRRAGTTGNALPVASVTASADDGNGPENVVDGSLGSRWSAPGDGQTLTLDLGRVSEVSAAAVAFYNGHTRTSTFDVLASRNGSSWNELLTGAVSSGTTDDLETYDLETSRARYLRIVGHGNSVSDFNSILEVRAYATDADAAADRAPSPVRLGRVTPSPGTLPELAVGERAGLSLTGVQTDGSTADLSAARVDWVSANPGVADVDENGQVTAIGGGSTTVGAVVTLGSVWKAVRVPVVVVDPGHIEPGADTHVRNGASADVNYGRGALEVRNNPSLGSGFERIAYLTFPLSAAQGRTITAAVVHVNGRLSTENTTTSVGVHAVADTGWVETALTWNTRPPLGDRVGTLRVSGTEAGWYTVDVTELVRGLAAEGRDLGVALTGDVATYGPHVQFNARESSVDRPYLAVTTAP
ncbi:CBM96 family carbohydrate-binding protein [Jiangella endophytica]|uniref:CBM96 family carbohydrate-binding protein n=1 Tax=Jiangella endophytica TaxID=1623398 RepID=UPI000E345E25|nr:DNRLRE domain-containing protein [Jiangella endophytica]